MVVIYLMVCLFIQDRVEIDKLFCLKGTIGNEKLH